MKQIFITTTNAMSKVLKITKTDKTVHVVPVDNRAFYEAYNNRQPADQKWKIEEIDEKEAKDLPFKDETYMTGAEAAAKAVELAKTVEEKDAEIERLKAQLAAASTPAAPVAPKLKADEVIALIEAATSVEQVEVLAKDDERKTVKEAAEKRIAVLKA